MIKTTLAISTTEIALMAVAFIRNKYLAIEIGPEGFGIYGLLHSFFTFVSLFSGAWLAGGATKFISEYDEQKDNIIVQKISSLSIGLTFVISLIITLIFIIAQKPIRRIFLSEEVFSIYFTLFAVAFIGMSLRPIFIALLQGLRQVKSVVFSRIVISAFEIILVIILVYFFDLVGFFLSILITSVFALVFLWKQLKKNVRKFSFPKLNENISQKLLFFGGSSLFLGLLLYGGEYSLRFIIIKNIDITAIGLFQAAMALMGYLGILNRGAVFNFYTDISVVMDNINRTLKINEYLRFVLLMNIPISVFAILSGKQIILLLFSSKFLPLSGIFFWFVLTHFMNSIAHVFHNNMKGMGLIKDFTFLGILGTFLLLIVPVIFIREIGLSSVAIGYLLSYGGTIPIFYWYLNKKINFRFSTLNLWLFFIAGLTLFGAILLMNNTFSLKFMWGIASLFLIGLTIKKDEYNKLFNFLLGRLNFINLKKSLRNECL
ncbi:MAG: oligosaccharide flippase family protein [Candidatus Hodarchaeota archaeon]